VSHNTVYLWRELDEQFAIAENPAVGERPDDEQVWVALLRIQARRGDVLSLQTSLRRLRSALAELGHGSDPETVRLPPNVPRTLDEAHRRDRADSGHDAAD
jgi:hypothetical protein